jgi:hypothetical protein
VLINRAQHSRYDRDVLRNRLRCFADHGQQTLLVINDNDGSSFAAWQYVESTGGNEIAASELSLIGIFNANGTVSTSQFGFA